MAKVKYTASQVLAQKLKDAIRKRGWSITELSKNAKVERTLISRLLKGESRPPRTRKGHETAEQDPRYAGLAKALEIPHEEFIALVKSAQLDTTDLRDKELRQPAELPIPEEFDERHHEFHTLLRKYWPLTSENIDDLLKECVKTSGLPAGVAYKAMGFRRRIEIEQRYLVDADIVKERDYLGTPYGPRPSTPIHLGAIRCKAIADVLTALVEPEKSDHSDPQISVALFFYDLARLVQKRQRIS